MTAEPLRDPAGEFPDKPPAHPSARWCPTCEAWGFPENGICLWCDREIETGKLVPRKMLGKPLYEHLAHDKQLSLT